MHYIDALPETSEDAALKQLVRYLETHRLQQRLHQSHLPMFLSPMHKKHNNLDRQEERFLKLLAERKVTLDDLKQFFIKNWLVHHYRSNNPIADQITDREPEYLLSYYNLGPKRPAYFEEKQLNENDDRLSKDIGYGQTFDVDRDQLESILEKYIDFNHGVGTLHHEGGKEAAPMRPATAVTSAATEPEFTYKFDNSNLKEKHPFAVKPNDPRYNGEAPFSSGIHI